MISTPANAVDAQSQPSCFISSPICVFLLRPFDVRLLICSTKSESSILLPVATDCLLDHSFANRTILSHLIDCCGKSMAFSVSYHPPPIRPLNQRISGGLESRI
ncbi:unnamed protein product [Cylicocyclus nassatus]|uniref:Uncharacterized protein n=1 Tax=Cylicocyclus nassatus TaxID=53992 RepID=A0AA36HFF6_CYLNA|nr:unnamed protein product [Cylicocyclus nassatus]